MSLDRWKVLACATVVATSSVVSTDQPLVPAAQGPAAPAIVVAAGNPPKVLDRVQPPVAAGAENSSAVAVGTQVAGAEDPSSPAVVTPPASAAVKETPADVSSPPLAAATTNAPAAAMTAAKNPPPVMDAISPPTGSSAADAAAPVNPPVVAVQKPAPSFDGRILAAHNRERENLGLAPLSWNSALAQSALRWAEHLAQTGRFEHAPENRVAPEGENLWAGTRGYYTPEAMVNAWIREKRNFRPGVFPDNSVTGRVEDIGHYTQLVWRATREVGCAEAASAREDILVCRYAEAGNYRGEQPY
jgi:uncharacterized protein YkwD